MNSPLANHEWTLLLGFPSLPSGCGSDPRAAPMPKDQVENHQPTELDITDVSASGLKANVILIQYFQKVKARTHWRKSALHLRFQSTSL